MIENRGWLLERGESLLLVLADVYGFQVAAFVCRDSLLNGYDVDIRRFAENGYPHAFSIPLQGESHRLISNR